MPFNRLVTVLRSEISRRKNREQDGIFPSPRANNVDVNGNTRFPLGRTRYRKVSKDRKNSGRCNVCRKKGHFESQCWYRVKTNFFHIVDADVLKKAIQATLAIVSEEEESIESWTFTLSPIREWSKRLS